MDKFEEKYSEQIETLLKVKEQQDYLSQIEKEAKTILEEGMEEYGVASIKTKNITMSKVSESISTSIDLKKLEKEDPDCYKSLLKEYPKITTKKSYVIFKFSKV